MRFGAARIGATRASTRLALLCCLAGIAGAAWSEDLAAAHACAQLRDNSLRLACYDAAFAATSGAGAAPAPAPPAAARFGDHGQLRQEGKAAASLPKTLDAKVAGVVSLGFGKYRLTLDNGQVWETVQADWALDFKSGDLVTFSRLLLGAYQVSLSGHATSVGVKRIR